jgi:hypothetical protein
VEEYVGLVDQAIFELEELVATCAFDIETIDANLDFINRLLGEVRVQCASMADGSYLFGREDPPFMRLIRRCDEKTLPFIRLFYQINEAHRRGLDITAD